MVASIKTKGTYGPRSAFVPIHFHDSSRQEHSQNKMKTKAFPLPSTDLILCTGIAMN
jgi:hypothetical protein